MKDLFLNIHFLRNRLTELDLKQSWVAKKVGVDPKTLRRWLHGKVKKIQRANAIALAEVLETSIGELTLSSEEDFYATNQDQKTAAELLSSSQLLEKLGPIHEWNVVEALLKATLIPNLPLFVLGELYNKLSIASWRQSKIEAASLYAKKAFEIGQRTRDNVILANATFNLGNLDSWSGRIADAIDKYETCLSLQNYLPQSTIGSLYSNLGATYWEIGDLKKGLDTQLQAEALFQEYGSDMNRSICAAQLSFVYLEKKEWDLCEVQAHLSLEWAEKTSYLRGECMGHLILAELAARAKNSKEALSELETGIVGFQKLKIEENFNYEFIGRTYRLLNDLNASQKNLEHGLKLNIDFPIYRAALFRELGITLSLQKAQKPKIRDCFLKAHSLYSTCGAPLRAKQVKTLEKTYA